MTRNDPPRDPAWHAPCSSGFNAGSFTEWHDLGINVFTHGTLFDDMMPYDSETWILPFTTNTNPVADYLP